jgi:anti-sigma-K factor RskA
MNYQGRELLARLADEYVIGTLRGRARVRFERLLESNDSARAEVRRAEDQLLQLSLALAPVQPAPVTWIAIANRIGGQAPAQTRAPTQATQQDRPRRQRPARTSWRVALAAAAAMFAIGIAWVVIERTAPPTAIANLATEGGSQVWTVATYVDRARLSVEVTGAVKLEPGRDYELWALPEGGAPVSLGLMPEGGKLQRELTAVQIEALRVSPKVAVSLEPDGGSRTGAPTGPVLFVADLQVATRS